MSKQLAALLLAAVAGVLLSDAVGRARCDRVMQDLIAEHSRELAMEQELQRWQRAAR